MQRISIFLAMAILMSVFSCGGLRIEKRRYNKGFYINFHSKTSVASTTPIDSLEPAAQKNTSPTIQSPYKKHAEPAHTNTIKNKAYIAQHNPVNNTSNTYNNRKKTIASAQTHAQNQPHATATINAQSTAHLTVNQQQDQNTNGLLTHAALFFGAGLLFIAFAKNRTQAKHALWAAKNPRKARLTIAGLQMAGVILAGVLGFLLSTSAITFSPLWAGIMVVPYLVFFLHKKSLPHQKQKQLRQSKFYILLNSLTGMFAGFMAGLGNVFGNISKWSFSNGFSNTNLHGNSEYALSSGTMVLFFILTLLLVAGILYLTAIISCELSCSGQSGAAAFVTVFGILVALLVLIFCMRKIFAKKTPATN
ncbi:MAG TPA: hypothetical protein VK177_01990 [Flavobacteriales bacterium]|nr:hypothetical protein [Flavobacteriales bacterium]